MILALVTLAGAVGCVVRYLMEYSVGSRHAELRPWMTVVVNALGSGVAGWAAYRLSASMDADVRSIVLTGFCGGLTTFSSAFAIPIFLAREHRRGLAIALVMSTPLLCAVAFVAGAALSH